MSCHTKVYDVIVCGAGHAGTEAALAAARMGASTLLVTGNLDTIGQMSCNPAIGGQAKGQIVREIDALGGEMAINTDTTGIQFRLLNESKGLAVQSPRAQCDKKAYQQRLKQTLEHEPNLTLFQATVTGLVFVRGKLQGCVTNVDVTFHAQCVVVTTGTFLQGIVHIGAAKNEGGRLGEFSAMSLSGSLEAVGIELRRFKTGTPPRVLGRTIDFRNMGEQKGDLCPTLFAFHDTRRDDELFHVEQQHFTEKRPGWAPAVKQVSCWTTYTSPRSREIVLSNLCRSALFSGGILGVGPRYCPSIEDKFVRFADKPHHLLFLEPEGRGTNEYYINGLSTSLPVGVQTELVRSVPGLERAVLLRPAYAVEYDYAPPTQLFPTLESKKIESLFFAGQINGTSGYEEAAAQGLIAGINAARKSRGESQLVVGRDEGYIGVLIDDLVTKGTNEPYRMLTSRAEYRLRFNHGSAEFRMLRHAEAMGLISNARISRIRNKQTIITKLVIKFESERSDTENLTWADKIRQMPRGNAFPAEFAHYDKSVRDETLYRIIYKGYLEHETTHAARQRHSEELILDQAINYLSIDGLRKEGAEKLSAHKPMTLDQASRISGVTPADISVLLVWLAARQARGVDGIPSPLSRKSDRPELAPP